MLAYIHPPRCNREWRRILYILCRGFVWVEHHRLFAHFFPDVRFYAPFGNDFLQIKRFHSAVGDIPAQRLKERVDQLLARLSFVKRWGFELMDILFERNEQASRSWILRSFELCPCCRSIGGIGFLPFPFPQKCRKSLTNCNELTTPCPSSSRRGACTPPPTLILFVDGVCTAAIVERKSETLTL